MIHRFAKGATVSQGTGLGLSIAREFMLAMGDSINHDPTLSAGESFTFRIRSAQQRLERKGSRSNKGQQPNARTLFIIKVCRGEGHLRCGGLHDAVHAH